MIQKPDETLNRAYRRNGITYVLLNIQDEQPVEVQHGLGEIPIEVSICASESKIALKQIVAIDGERIILSFEGSPTILRLRIV